jgi:MFS family permease
MSEEPAHPYLLVLVTVTGACVLALEILGTRVVGTYYGSSLYVWAALLSVTLTCLAVGYAVGGRLADRVPRAWMLYLLVMLAGGSVLLTGPLKSVLAPAADWFGLAWGALASALVIFFLPLTLLATASPYVIRLMARRIESVGSASGAVYAVSTVGSVGGALAAGFWMIPTLGTAASLNVISGVLIGVGALGLVLQWRGRAAPLFLLCALPFIAGIGERSVRGELYHTESAYGDLRVLQRDQEGRGPHRMLMVDGIMQTGMPLDIDLVDAGAILQSDSYYLELLPYFHPDLGDGREGVLIGLAGGMFPRVMEFYNIHWTAIEIDLKVAELAKAYFGYRGDIFDSDGTHHRVDLSRFPDREKGLMTEDFGHTHRPSGPYRGRAVIEDGRRYLRRHREPVDFIVLDAYNSDVIPFHLITREFFELIESRLTEDGILAINYIGRPTEDLVTDSLFRTLGEVFGSDMVRAYRTRDDESEVQVMIVFAFRQQMQLLPLWQAWQPSTGVDRLSYELSRRKMDTDRSGGTVITDNHNPIDLARAETALAWRRQTAALLR